MFIPSSDGDVWLHKSSVASWLSASVLEQVPGVGVVAASHGHAPDWCLQHSLSKLWHGWPSALQPELPRLHPFCWQRGIHSLPQHHRAQVEWWVWKSKRWAVGEKKGRWLVSLKDLLGDSSCVWNRVLIKCCWGGITESVRGHTAWCYRGAKDCLKRVRWWICCLRLSEWVS